LIVPPKNVSSVSVGVSEQVKELLSGMHEAFFLLGGADPLQYEAIRKMEVFTFFRFLNSKKQLIKSKRKKK
jgi:hypothetical protein